MSEKEQLNKKEIFKKWWFWVIIFWALTIGFGVSSELSNTANTQNTVENQTFEISDNNNDVTYNKSVLNIDSFIENFNKISQSSIININSFNPNDKNDSHYRVEFRLNPFKNSKGKYGTISNDTIDIIDYSSENTIYSNNIRIYATVSNDTIFKDILENTITIFDSTVTNKQIQDIYNSLNIASAKTLSLGKNNCITGYIEKKKDSYDVMIDMSKHYNKN